MSLFNQLVGGGYPSEGQAMAKSATGALGTYKQRTFREQIQDQIAFHKAKIDDLQEVLDSMSPEVEKFVEAIQKING